MCVAFDVNPGGHCWHDPAPGDGEMKPFGQVVQPMLPGNENVPAGQVLQAPLPGPENDPAGQLEQNALPGLEKVPPGQVAQDALPARENDPAGQREQNVFPEPAAKRPAGQGLHGALPLGLEKPGLQSWAKAGELPATTRRAVNKSVKNRMDRSPWASGQQKTSIV